MLFMMLIAPSLICEMLPLNELDYKFSKSIVQSVSLLVISLWCYSVASFFRGCLGKNGLKQKRILDSVLGVLLLFLLFYPLSRLYNTEVEAILPWWLLVGFQILLIALFLAMVFFGARALVALRKMGRENIFDILSEMLNIIWFPIGIWWMQCRVNRYYSENCEEHQVNKSARRGCCK